MLSAWNRLSNGLGQVDLAIHARFSRAKVKWVGRMQMIWTKVAAMEICRAALLTGGIAVAMAACSPTIKVEAPDKPIEINLNVKIEQEIRVKVDRDLDDLLANNPDLF